MRIPRRIAILLGGGAAAAAAAAATLMLASGASGTDDAADNLRALTTGAPAALDARAIDSLRSSGVDVTTGGAAVTVKAPNGVDERWTIAQDDDAACLVVPRRGGSAATCGPTALLRRDGIIGFTPDARAAASLGLPATLQEAKTTRPSAPSGSVSYRGLAADDVESAAALTKDGRVLVSRSVTSNVFELPDVPFADVDAIEFTHNDGARTAVPVGQH